MPLPLEARLAALGHSYLLPQGWDLDSPRSPQGPVPWITYPALAMLKRIVRPTMRVLEYGCGSSTLWWARHVREVVSVEHNSGWAGAIRPQLPAGVRATILVRGHGTPVPESQAAVLAEFDTHQYDLPCSPNAGHNIEHGLLCEGFQAYAGELLNYPVGYFDVVSIDGMARTLTAWLAARQLGPRGLILFDNSERWQYNAAYQLLTDAGFARIDFWGPGRAVTSPGVRACSRVTSRSSRPIPRLRRIRWPTSAGERSA